MFKINVKRVHAPGGNKTFETSRKRLKSSRGMFRYDSITVSSAWELHQYLCVTHRGTELIPPCLGLCTVPTSCLI